MEVKTRMKLPKLISNLAKLFEISDHEDDINEVSNQMGFIDSSQICMVKFKSDSLWKRIGNAFESSNFYEGKVIPSPKIDFKAISKFKASYLRDILACAEAEEFVTISLSSDSPVKIETKNFEFYLAPRIDEK